MRGVHKAASPGNFVSSGITPTTTVETSLFRMARPRIFASPPYMFFHRLCPRSTTGAGYVFSGDKPR